MSISVKHNPNNKKPLCVEMGIGREGMAFNHYSLREIIAIRDDLNQVINNHSKKNDKQTTTREEVDMIEQGHTPGPWDWHAGNANGRGLIRIETAINNPNGGGEHIASMPRGAKSEANARLIASAPELLSSLQRLAAADEYAESCGVTLDDHMNREARRELYRAAIARATREV